MSEQQTIVEEVIQDLGLDAQWLTSTDGLLTLAAVGGLIGLKFFGKDNNKKLASGHWAGNKEKNNARDRALKQIANPEQDSAALWIGTVKPERGTPAYESARLPNKGDPVFWQPDIQRGTLVLGSNGSGKTDSFLNGGILSAMAQGFPIVLYDFKYPSQSKLAVYAKRLGYEVSVFAPGFPESCVCNPLDFLRDETDAETARQIASTVNKNFKKITQQQEDGYFGPAGDQAVEASLLLAKSSEYPDVITANQILSAEELVKRLKKADLNPWVKLSFAQLLSTAGSEKTTASIISTASLMFSRFMKQRLLSAFVGKTTLPLDLKPKQMVIFGLDRTRRAVCGPLVCSIVDALVSRNISYRREEPLCFFADEFPTLYLPNIGRWLNEARSEGFCGQIAAQSMSQIHNTYGENEAKTILGGCNTKVLFNIAEPESAKKFSDALGDESIDYVQKSRSRSRGHSTKSKSYQERTRKLVEAAAMGRMPTGKAIVLSPGYGSGKGDDEETYVPVRHKFKLSKHYKAIKRDCERNWHKLQKALIKQSQQQQPTERDLMVRRDEVDRLLPLEEGEQTPVAPSTAPYNNIGF